MLINSAMWQSSGRNFLDEIGLAYSLHKHHSGGWKMEGSSVPVWETSKNYSGVFDSKLQVLIAESIAQNSSLVLQSLSDLKECDFTICSDQEGFLKMTSDIQPDGSVDGRV